LKGLPVHRNLDSEDSGKDRGGIRVSDSEINVFSFHSNSFTLRRIEKKTATATCDGNRNGKELEGQRLSRKHVDAKRIRNYTLHFESFSVSVVVSVVYRRLLGLFSLARIVPTTGLEPVCPFGRQILSLLRIPFRHIGFLRFL
jgi:hypothetical protein